MALQRSEAASNVWVAAAVGLAAVVMASPLYIGLFERGSDRLRRDVDLGVARVERMLHKADESLAAVAETRGRLAAFTAEESDKAADAGDSEKSAGAKMPELRGDRLIALAEREQRRLVGKPDDVKIAQTTLPKLLEESTQLVNDAEKEIRTVLSLTGGDARASDNLWANRAAAMVALARGRIERDRGWWNRWQAGELWSDARRQASELAAMKRGAAALQAASPRDAVQALKSTETKLAAAIEQARATVTQAAEDVAACKARIAELRGKSQAATAEIARIDAEWLKAAESRQARNSLTTSGTRYTALSAEQREADRAADTLEHGALEGGALAAKAEGDFLEGAYEGGKAATGLVELEARHAAADHVEKELAAQLKSVQDEAAQLAETNDRQVAVRETLQKSISAREEQLAAARKQIDDLLAAAEKSESAAIAAFVGGGSYVSKAQTAAKRRASDAATAQREAGGDQKSRRLEHITTDKETEAGVLVLGANLSWAAAETYAQGILDARAVAAETESQDAAGEAADTSESTEEGESSGAAAASRAAPVGKIAQWRAAANDQLAKATKFVTDAKTLVAQGNYETNDGQRLAGANFRWQLSQLEAAVHMLSAVLAENEETAEAARTKARTALQEALQGHETSPLLVDAAAALQSIQ